MTTPSEGEAMLALADEYDRGTEKMLASGYEEFGEHIIARHRLISKALRTAAQSSGVREALQWIAGQRDAAGIRVSDICTVADRALSPDTPRERE